MSSLTGSHKRQQRRWLGVEVHSRMLAQPVISRPTPSWRMIAPCATIEVVDTSRIAAFNALADLPAAELDELAAVMREVEVEASTKVVTLDDYGTAIYFIEQGEADVLLDGGEVAQTLGPGDTFGEIALLLTGQRMATVLARSPMRLLSLAGEDFERIRARVPELERTLRRLGLGRAAP
jgi:CRP-like cAMP-binding protein